MEEKQVSLDGVSHPLPEPFFVIGTQNPMHQSGTYPLPESQLDRFLMRIQLGYPDWQAEKSMLTDALDGLQQPLPVIMQPEQFHQAQANASKVHAADPVIDYILRLVTYSRESGKFPNPLSPRASKALLQSARAWAYVQNRDYLIPEDVQAVLPAVAEHRLRSSLTDLHGTDNLSTQLLEAIDPLAA